VVRRARWARSCSKPHAATTKRCARRRPRAASRWPARA
jgi:hypothetical protein